MINIIVPMTGSNKFEGEEYVYPKPVIDIDGRTMFERALLPFLKIETEKNIIPIISSGDVKSYSLDYVIKQVLEGMNYKVLEIESNTKGAVCTTLMAIDHIDNDEPLIVTNGDHVIDYDLNKVLNYFYDKDTDYGVLCFESVHPKWSYVRLDECGTICEAAEKKPLSKNAIAGFYYFKRGKDFVRAAMSAISKNTHTGGSFYISCTLNEMVLAGASGKIYQVPNEFYTNFYDVSIIKAYEGRIREKKVKRTNIFELTELYIAGFDSKNLDKVGALLADDVILEDPEVKRIEGKVATLDAIKEIFQSCNRLSFNAKKIICQDCYSVIEFVLTLDQKIIEGVDLIYWEDSKICSLKAYLE